MEHMTYEVLQAELSINNSKELLILFETIMYAKILSWHMFNLVK